MKTELSNPPRIGSHRPFPPLDLDGGYPDSMPGIELPEDVKRTLQNNGYPNPNREQVWVPFMKEGIRVDESAGLIQNRSGYEQHKEFCDKFAPSISEEMKKFYITLVPASELGARASKFIPNNKHSYRAPAEGQFETRRVEKNEGYLIVLSDKPLSRDDYPYSRPVATPL